jgi:hypothetical protein
VSAVMLLFGVPAVTQLSWDAMRRFMPDLTLVLLAISALCAGGGVVGADQLARLFSRRQRCDWSMPHSR